MASKYKDLADKAESSIIVTQGSSPARGSLKAFGRSWGSLPHLSAPTSYTSVMKESGSTPFPQQGCLSPKSALSKHPAPQLSFPHSLVAHTCLVSWQALSGPCTIMSARTLLHPTSDPSAFAPFLAMFVRVTLWGAECAARAAQLAWG